MNSNFRNSGPPSNDAYRGYPGHGYPPPAGQPAGPRPPYGPQQQPQQPVTSGTPPHSLSQAPALSTSGPPAGPQVSTAAPAAANNNVPSNQPPTQGMPPSSAPQNYPSAGPPPGQDYYNRPDQVCSFQLTVFR
jgi:hypothetical protein